MPAQAKFDPKTYMKELREWADGKIQGGEEPPWAWYQYMKLIETIDTISEAMGVTATENSQQSLAHQEMPNRPTETMCRLSTSQLHLGSTKKPLPM